MVQKITEALERNGYFDIEFNYQDGKQFFFEGYSDAHQEIRVDVNEETNQISIYDRYVEEKHYAPFKNVSLS